MATDDGRADRIPGLDGARGIAAGLVVVGAALAGQWPVSSIPGQIVALSPFIGIAGLGLVSAVLLGRRWASQSGRGSDAPALRQAFGWAWLRGRFLRIAPLYWLVSCAYLWTTAFFPESRAAIDARLTIPTFTHLYILRPWPAGTDLWWSIAVYLSFAVVLAVAVEWAWSRRRLSRRLEGTLTPRAVFGAVFVGAVIALAWRSGIYAVGGDSLLLDWPFAYLDWAVAGCALGVAKELIDSGRWSRPRWLGEFADHAAFAWLTAAGVVLVTAQGRFGAEAITVNPLQRELRHYGAAVAVGFFLLPILFGRGESRLARWTEGSSARLAGSLSFGVLLWYSGALRLIIGFTTEGRLPSNAFVRVVAEGVVTFGLAAVTYVLVERPLRRFSVNPPTR
jgi:peptidoglycan/LPS O-acetylase OafA/YrhL